MDPFTDEESRAAWNEGARAWEAFVEGGADFYRHEVHGPALLSACGPVDGLRVLDLGCGQGYFTRKLARAGAAVIGVDLADELVASAREHEAREPVGARYERLGAAEASARWPAGHFDRVTSCMAVQDMAEVPRVLQGAFALLRPGGRMVFSVPHPATDTAYREWDRDLAGRKRALKLDRYFEGGPATCHWNMPRLEYHWRTPCWRYTISEWSDLIADAGFLVARLHEPRPTAEQVRRVPELEDCARMPYFLIFDLLRPADR